MKGKEKFVLEKKCGDPITLVKLSRSLFKLSINGSLFDDVRSLTIQSVVSICRDFDGTIIICKIRIKTQYFKRAIITKEWTFYF